MLKNQNYVYSQSRLTDCDCKLPGTRELQLKNSGRKWLKLFFKKKWRFTLYTTCCSWYILIYIKLFFFDFETKWVLYTHWNCLNFRYTYFLGKPVRPVLYTPNTRVI